MSDTKWPPRKVTTPSAAEAEYNQPVVKYYAFNETGNIMLSSTEKDSQKINPDVLSLFEEVAVFFAALTKAITSTTRPGAKAPYKPWDYYTIYDYVPLENIVNNSGLFVNVHREDIAIHKESVTATFNIEFIEAVLGVALTDGVGAGALMASLNAMGKQASVSYSRTKEVHQIGNLLFVCEYILGMPIVDVLYFYLDQDQTKTVIDVSPCVKTTKSEFDLAIHKDTFLFVVPEWIRKYAGDLASVEGDAEYQQLVDELKAYISDTPVILGLEDAGGATTKLTDTKPYTLRGLNLGTTQGKVSIGGQEQHVAAASDWTPTSVQFTAKKPASGGGGPIVLTTTGADPQSVTSHFDVSFS